MSLLISYTSAADTLITQSGTAIGQVLAWNGSEYVPTTLPPSGATAWQPSTSYSSGQIISNAGVYYVATNSFTSSTTFGTTDLANLKYITQTTSTSSYPVSTPLPTGYKYVAGGVIYEFSVDAVSAASFNDAQWNSVGQTTGVIPWQANTYYPAGSIYQRNNTIFAVLPNSYTSGATYGIADLNATLELANDFIPTTYTSGGTYAAGQLISLNGILWYRNTNTANASATFTPSEWTQLTGNAPGSVTNAMLASAPAGTVKARPTTAGAPTDVPIGGGLTLDNTSLRVVNGGANGEVLIWTGSAWTTGLVTSTSLGTDAVTSAKILANAVTAVKIANDNVSDAKLANMPASTLKGRNSSSSGDPQNILLGSGLSMSSTGVLSATQIETIGVLSSNTTNIAPGWYELDSVSAAFSITLANTLGKWVFTNARRSSNTNKITISGATAGYLITDQNGNFVNEAFEFDIPGSAAVIICDGTNNYYLTVLSVPYFP